MYFISTDIFSLMLLLPLNYLPVRGEGVEEGDERVKGEKKMTRWPGNLPPGQASPKISHNWRSVVGMGGTGK